MPLSLEELQGLSFTGQQQQEAAPVAPVAEEPEEEQEEQQPNLLQRAADLVTGADDSLLTDVGQAVGVAAESGFIRPLYNTLYDNVAETLGQGVGEERRAITGFNDDGTFKEETFVVPEVEEDVAPPMFKDGNVNMDYIDHITSMDPRGPRLGLLPMFTGTKRKVIGENGELKTVRTDAPFPIVGDVPRMSTGNALADAGLGMIGQLAQLLTINKGMRAAGVPRAPGAQALNKIAANPQSNRLQRLGATAAREYVDLLPASLVQREINNPYLEGTGVSALGDLGVLGAQEYFPNNPEVKAFAEKLQSYTNNLRINPDDPLEVARGKALADELVFMAPLGGILGTTFSALSKNGMQGAAFRELSEEMQEAYTDAAGKLILANKAEGVAQAVREVPEAPEVPTAEAPTPEVRVYSAAERKLDQVRRAEELRQKQGIERGEATEQLTTDPDRPRVLGPAEADAIAEQKTQEAVASVQRLQTVVAKAGQIAQPQAQPRGVDPQVATLGVEEIYTAPKQLQYKLGGIGKGGSTGSLSDVKNYDPDLAGVMLVWRDVEGELGPAGRIYAVDGHNRLELAQRSGWQGGMNVMFINDAPTAAAARMKGALSNIAHGNGTPIDAAKAMRDGNLGVEDLRAKNLSIKASVANTAIGLKGLPQDLFDQVIDGKISQNAGAIVGRSNLDAQVQRELIQAAKKKKWSDSKLREATAMSFDTVVEQGVDEGMLPGFGEFISTDWNKRMDVRIAIRGHHMNVLRAMGAVTNSKRSVELEKAGNVLDFEASAAAEESAKRGIAIFNKVAGMSGPVSDLISELVAEIGPGKSAKQLVERNAQRINEVLESYIKKDLAPAQAAKDAAAKEAAKSDAEDAILESEAEVPQQIVEKKKTQIAAAEQYARELVKKSFAALPADKRQEVFEYLMRQYMEKGAITSNPFPINGKADQFPGAKVAEPEASPLDDVPAEAPQLPAALRQPVTRMTYKRAAIAYESDVDAAVYIYVNNAGKARRGEKTSKSWKKYGEFLDDLGIPEARRFEVFAQIKGQLDSALVGKQNNLRGSRNRATQGVDVTVPDTGLWRESGALMIELPPLNNIVNYGRLGEDFAASRGTTILDNPQLATELIDEVYQMTGMTRVRVEEQIEYVLSDSQAAQYGRQPGETGVARGMYVAGPREADDLIVLSMFDSSGKPTLFTKALQTIHHEAFHRLMKRHFTKADIAVMKDAQGEIAQIAMKVIPELAADIEAGRLDFEELAANAFMGMGLRPSLFKGVTWAEPMKKARKMLDATRNFLLGRGFRTWDDVFASAYAGDFAGRAKAAADGEMGMPTVRYSIDDVDPEEIAKGILEKYGDYEARIASGDMTVEDALANEIRRGISRGGNHRYVSKSGEEHAAFFAAVRDSVTQNMEKLTGIRKYNAEQNMAEAMSYIADHGTDADDALEFYKRLANSGLPGSSEVQAGIAAIRFIGDVHNNSARQFALAYRQTEVPQAKVDAVRGLVAATADMMAYRVELRRRARNASHTMLQMKEEIETSITSLPMPRNAELRVNLPEEQVEQIMKEGFGSVPAKPGLMGDGIYMTSDLAQNLEWGNSQITGELNSDIKILDMIAMDKSIGDLLHDLGLGPMKKKGKTFSLSDAQREGLRDYAQRQGFAGIRYESDYTAASTPSDEIFIFDEAKANLIANTDNSVDPRAQQIADAAKEGADQIFADPYSMMDSIADDLIDAIEDGKGGIETDRLAEALIAIVESEPAEQLHMADLLMESKNRQGTADMFFNAYRGGILYSGQTWAKMGMGTAVRALVMPYSEASGHMLEGGGKLLAGAVGDKRMLSTSRYSFAKAVTAPMKHAFYVAHMPMALRMAFNAARFNTTLGRVGPGTGFDEAGGTFARGGVSRHIKTGPQGDPLHNLAFYALAPFRQGGRVSASIDTFFTYLAGPTEKLYANFETAFLEQISKGKGLDTALSFAFSEAQRRSKKEFADLVIDGNVIKNGVMTPEHVSETLNYLNFSDPLKITRDDVGARTYKEGLNVARREGLTDPVDIHNRAVEHSEEVTPIKTLVAGGKILDRNFPGLNYLTGGHVYHNLHKEAFGKFTFPILKTPINIWKAHNRAMFPANLTTDTWYKDLVSENPPTRARAAGEVAATSAIFAALGSLVDNGTMIVTGPNPVNYRKRANDEMVRNPPYSVAFRQDDGSYSDWYSVEAFDILASFISVHAALREKKAFMTQEEIEGDVCAGVLCLNSMMRDAGAYGRVNFIDPLNRNTMASIREVIDLVARVLPEEEGQHSTSPGDALRRYLVRKASSFTPAFIRNIKTDATEMRYGPTGQGIVPRSLPEHVQVFLTNLDESFASQAPNAGSREYVYLDPITAYPVYKANSPDLWEAHEDDQRWVMAVLTQFTPHAGIRSMPQRQGMPVHEEIARLQRHNPQPIVLLTRRNLTFEETENGKTKSYNLADYEARGLRITNTDVNQIKEILAKDIKINGVGVEAALTRIIKESPEYRAIGTYRVQETPGGKRVQARTVLLLKEYAKYRKLAVAKWLQQKDGRGPLFLEAHEAFKGEQREANLIYQQRLEFNEQIRRDSQQALEQEEQTPAAPSAQGRVAQDIGSFTRAVGTQ